MVVEDPFISNYVRSVLARHGCRVALCDLRTALEMTASGETKVRLVVTNQPEAFREWASSLPVIYVSSSPNPTRVAAFASHRILNKPFRPLEMLTAVRGLLGPGVI